MSNKMPSPAMFCKSNERGMRYCDKCWKGKSELQSYWEKIYILKYKPADSIYTSIMKFRYLEDYRKMKKIDKMLGKIMILMQNANKGLCGYSKERYIYLLKERLLGILSFLKECNFLNVDFDDGICFEHKFLNISHYILNGDKNHVEFIFGRLLKHFKDWYDSDGADFGGFYHDLKYKIIPLLVKIRDELLERGIKIFD